LHFARLAERIGTKNPAALATLQSLAARFEAVLGDPARAERAALRKVVELAHREALAIAFADALSLMAALFALSLVLVPLLRRPKNAAAAEASAH
jgi:DHA2 family multidrug resistance protein